MLETFRYMVWSNYRNKKNKREPLPGNMVEETVEKGITRYKCSDGEIKMEGEV